MGIPGLKPYLAGILKVTHISELAGRVCAVDISGWLNMACMGCAEDLVVENKIVTFVIDYCMRNLTLMESYGLRPFVVFDGARLPAKADTHKKRAAARAQTKARVLEKFKANPKDASLAKKVAESKVSVTFRIVSNLISALNAAGVQYVVAPYEADAQIASLFAEKLVSVVITEDTDLVIHGCPLIMYDTDLRSGQCVLYDASLLDDFVGMKESSALAFRNACLAAGTDYWPGIQGFGIKKAMKEIENVGGNITLGVEKMISKSLVKPKDPTATTETIRKGLRLADFVFRHQTVWELSPLAPFSAVGLRHVQRMPTRADGASGPAATTYGDSKEEESHNLQMSGPWVSAMTTMPISASRGIICPSTGGLPIPSDLVKMPYYECLAFMRTWLVPEVWAIVSLSEHQPEISSQAESETSRSIYQSNIELLNKEESWLGGAILSPGDGARLYYSKWYRDFDKAKENTCDFQGFINRFVHESLSCLVAPGPSKIAAVSYDDVNDALLLDMVSKVEADAHRKKRSRDSDTDVEDDMTLSLDKKSKIVDGELAKASQEQDYEFETQTF